MQRKPIFGMLALSCLVGGCYPVRVTVVPEINGRVVDASGRPVPGATVVVTELNRAEPPPPLQLQCDSSGRFHREAEAPWGIYIVPMDIFGHGYNAVATFDGQQSESKKFGTGWAQVRILGLGGVQCADLGDLTLAPPASVKP